MTNLFFPLLSFMFNFANILGTRAVPKKYTGTINLINNQLVPIPNLVKYFTALLPEKTFLKD